MKQINGKKGGYEQPKVRTRAINYKYFQKDF
jgi:hypothetical protein